MGYGEADSHPHPCAGRLLLWGNQPLRYWYVLELRRLLLPAWHLLRRFRLALLQAFCRCCAVGAVFSGWIPVLAVLRVPEALQQDQIDAVRVEALPCHGAVIL